MQDDVPELNAHDVIADAIARGISAEDQFARLYKACDRCAKAKKKGIVPRIEADIRCMNTCRMANIVLENASAIDQAIFGDDVDHSPLRPDQDRSDEYYLRQYWQFFGKSRAEIERALNNANRQRLNLVTRAQRTALFDLLQGRAYGPPLLDQDAAQPVDTLADGSDHGETGMQASSLRGRARKGGRKRSRTQEEALMPVPGYWMTETATGRTVHFAYECPTRPNGHSDFELLEEARHPLQVADDLNGHPCGSCMKILEAADKEGFLFGTVSNWRTLVVRRDRIEYQTPSFRPGGKNFTMAADALEGIAFPSLTKLVLDTPEFGEITIRLDSPTEADVAKEAFRRLGWSFED